MVGTRTKRLMRARQAEVVVEPAPSLPTAMVGMQVLDRLMGISEDERQRLAADLHDGPLQQLTAIGLRLSRARILMARGDVATAMAVIAEANAAVEREARGLRMTMADLGAPSFEDVTGIQGGIRDHLMRLGSVTQFECAIESQLTWRAPAAVELLLYRVAQEALSNVVSHSGCGQAEVSIFREAGCVVIVVRDNGCGFDVAQQAENVHSWRGFGLRYMHDLVTIAGGEFAATSVIGRGTAIRASVPESRRLP